MIEAENLRNDSLHEECGVFGIFGHPDAAPLTVLGLHALQHRGHEAAGIVTYDGTQFRAERHLGLVGDVFGGRNIVRLEDLSGSSAVGHNQYAGTGARNILPIHGDLTGGGIALAHNGSLTNAVELRAELVQDGRVLQSTSDAEIIIQLAARSRRRDILDKLIDALRRVEGAYSLVALTSRQLIGARDPRGVRPLVLGKLADSYVLASETCALHMIGAEYVRDVQGGELVVITRKGVESYFPFPKLSSRFCVFEYIFFSRPDSIINGRSVYQKRRQSGVELAREAPAVADLVVPIPESSVPAAIGFADEAGLPLELGIIRNGYVGRSLLEPSVAIRNFSVRKKHSPNRAAVENKRIVLIDDSIVRGTTAKAVVAMLRDAGAAEIHYRVASPPMTSPCFYGVDTPYSEDLLAHGMNVDDMCRFIAADSLSFVSMDGLYRAMGAGGRQARNPQFCDACFSGDYPIRLTDVDSSASEERLVVEFAAKFRERIELNEIREFEI